MAATHQPVLLSHNLLLGQRLYVHACLRFGVVVAIAGGAWFADNVVGIEQLPTAGLCVVAAVLFSYNIPAFIVARRYRDLEKAAGAFHALTITLHLTIALDFVVLTVALWLVGGSASPFQAWYILHIVVASVLLSHRAAIGFALLGYLLFAGLVVGEWMGLLPMYRPAGAVPGAGLDGRYVLTVLVVQGLLVSFATFLLVGLAHVLRLREMELREANKQLERLSEMRRDFLHITLHDLKSPIVAAVSHLNNLAAGFGGRLSEQQGEWVERSQARLHEVLGFLRDLSMLAELEAGRLNAAFEPVDVKVMLESVAQSHEDRAAMRRHTVRLELPDALPPVLGIERLLHEVVANLLTNAIRYTPPDGTIVVRARKAGERVRIEVEDNGIGIAPENQKRLFREFVRLRRTDTETEQSGGTGLGLSIARRIVESHRGTIGVSSVLDQGSVFHVELPVAPRL